MSNPIRVAQIMGYMNGGGVESVVMNYYRNIDRARVQFDFLVCEGSSRIPADEIEHLGGRVFMVPSYADVAGYQDKLRRLYCKCGWGVVHSHLNALSVFPLRAAKKEGVPVRIAHSHSTAGKGEFVKNAAKQLLKTQSNRYPTHRLACSRAAGEWLFGTGTDFDVVPNGIDLEKFCSADTRRSASRRRLGIDDGEFVVCHIGRFMTQKNHQFLIEVFARLLDVRPDSRLLLVGEGELLETMRTHAKCLGVYGKTIFAGQREDVEDMYACSDVFCLPSLYEGLGMVAIEAQASGVPCLLSDTITREVDVTGECRFLSIDSCGAWVEVMSSMGVGERRPNEKTSFRGYDIRDAASLLASRYEMYVAELIEGKV